MSQRKRKSILSQKIIACRLCGSPITLSCGHSQYITMTKAQAASVAISYAFKDEPDFKSRAAGER